MSGRIPSQEEAEGPDQYHSDLWFEDDMDIAAGLVEARANGTLMTRQEFINSLDGEAAAICLWGMERLEDYKKAHSREQKQALLWSRRIITAALGGPDE